MTQTGSIWQEALFATAPDAPIATTIVQSSMTHFIIRKQKKVEKLRLICNEEQRY